MKNIEQLLNKENWIKYLELADEGGITNHGIAQDIVSKIQQAINYIPCCTGLCDCEIPKPIDAYHPEDKNICRDCKCKIA